MNTHAVPALIADSHPIPAIDITGFRLWLLRLWQQRPEKASRLLVYAGLKTFLQDKRVLRENSEYSAWLINDVCNDEAVCIVHEKASGFLFFFCATPQAMPELVLENICHLLQV